MDNNKSSILVIHPEDESTTFLTPIYGGLENATLINGGKTYKEVKQLVQQYDKVYIMGHGMPSGLFSVGKFKEYTSYIVDKDFAPFLKTQSHNIYIWCHADQFVNTYQLKGFFSGMFISEVEESKYCGLRAITQKIIDESNWGFSEIVAKYIHLTPKELYENVKREYSSIAHHNPVAAYNLERLYWA
jgi:hypothetical protein